MADKSNCLTTSNEYYEYCGTVDAPIYEVRDGQITIKGKQYPIKLVDGYYIIRKLTVTECKRLQTVPDEYVFPVSDTQAYKMLGNGWTVDVIAHILSHIPGIQTDELEVLSMYDGMSCGHIALEKLGGTYFSLLCDGDRQVCGQDDAGKLPGDHSVGRCVSGAGKSVPTCKHHPGRRQRHRKTLDCPGKYQSIAISICCDEL